jgi:hypothetical protein
MGLDLTSFDGALKVHYTDDRVVNMVFKDNPLLALCPKMEAFGGRNLPIPIVYGNPQGRSRTFATAQTAGAATSTLIKDFVLTRKKDYSIATIDNETLEASKGDSNAFMEAATTEIDGAINSLTRSLAINLYRGTDCSIGQVSVEPTEHATTFDIVLKKKQDVSNFEVNQNIVIWSATTGGTQRNRNGTATVLPIAAVNRNTGTLTITGTYDSSGTIAANDYIFVDGDRGLGLSGLEDWIPSSDPSATTFYGVDRSVDVTRLGGLRLDATTLPIEEALIEADALVANEGFGVDHFLMHPSKFGDLKKALGSKVQYVDMQATATISFRGILVDGAKGPIKVVPDQNCPAARIHGVRMEYLKLYSLGKAVRVIDTDGLQMLRQATSDGVEVRYGYYANLGVRAPGSFINIQV